MVLFSLFVLMVHTTPNGSSITKVEAQPKKCFAKKSKTDCHCSVSPQASIWVEVKWLKPVMVCYTKEKGNYATVHRHLYFYQLDASLKTFFLKFSESTIHSGFIFSAISTVSTGPEAPKFV